MEIMKSFRNGIARSAWTFIGSMLVAVLLAAPVCAQIEFSDDAAWEVTPSSRYIVGKLGTSGWVKLSPSSPEWPIAGRWAVATVGGDPETAADDNADLNWLAWLCPHRDYGYWKVKIGDEIKFIGDPETGRWTKLPLTYETPPPGQGLGKAGGYLEAEWTITGTVLGDDGTSEVTTDVAVLNIRMSIVRDQVRFQLTLRNLLSKPQTMGIQMHCVAQLNSSSDPPYAYLPGLGYSRQVAGGSDMFPMLMTGKQIPASFDIYDNVSNPSLVARLSLKLQDCVAPDYLAIGDWVDLCLDEGRAPHDRMWLPDYYNFLYPENPINYFSWVATWSPRTVSGGGTRKVVTYYGVGAANMTWNYRVGAKMVPDSVAFSVQGPRAIKYDSVSNIDSLADQPFFIKAYLYNLATDPGPYDLENVTTTLYLPPGLELDTQTEQSAQQTVDHVPVKSEAQPVVWRVRATGEYSGELEYFVTARAASGWQQVVSRKVMVPATRRSIFRSGYQMMHVPFNFNNPTVEHAFGLPRGSFGAKYYDTATRQYMSVSNLKPGQAFWMYVGSVNYGATLPFELAPDAAIVGNEGGTQLYEQDIELEPGWNLIGNPFVYPVYWGQVLVWNQVENLTLTLDEAATRGWLSKTVFTWIPESRTYDSFKENDRYLLPWRGYWVRAKSRVTLVMRPAVPPGSGVVANSDGT